MILIRLKLVSHRCTSRGMFGKVKNGIDGLIHLHILDNIDTSVSTPNGNSDLSVLDIFRLLDGAFNTSACLTTDSSIGAFCAERSRKLVG